MINLNIPVGVSDFEQIRKNGYYYVDKSGIIMELLKTESTAVTLITRPRRFGKTLGMSMLASFFDIRKNSHAIFDGLEIMHYEKICQEWMNQYPTIFLSLKDVDGLNFSSAYEMFASVITDLYKTHLYLLNSEKINLYDRAIIQRVVEGTASVTEIKKSLQLLIHAMHTYYGKQVILLLDEYDVPLAKASNADYYAEMLDVIKVFMSTALKDNSDLKFAILTGCLKIAKESIFTGKNNFVSDTITTTGLNEYFGFTDREVAKILQDADALEMSQKIREWYDGYHFGKIDVYCPWDVMNYIRDFQKDKTTKPVGYWKNTSDNAIIRSFIEYAGNGITGKLETLMSGGYIIEKVEENLTYDYLHASEENLWSVLYLTGYLTRVRDGQLQEDLSDGMFALQIPNREIREIFESTVRVWFSDQAKIWDRKKLFEAVWAGQSEVLTEEMNALLRATISYHDYREDFYHAFLAGIFAGAGYRVESNREHGEGRSDIVVTDERGGRVAIFEAKYAKEKEGLEKSCEQALKQINEKMYDREFLDNYDEVLCYGISFFRKRCLVRKK